MRQAVCRTHGQIDVITTEPPRLEPGDLLVRLRLCGVCGTDLMKVYDPTVTKPVQIGHEVVGEVVAADPEAETSNTAGVDDHESDGRSEREEIDVEVVVAERDHYLDQLQRQPAPDEVDDEPA